MQDPVDPNSREFFEKDFRYYEDSQIVNIPGQVIMTIDPAFREHQDADYAVIMTCKVINEKLYIIEYVRKRFTMDTFTKEVIQQFLKHNPSKIGIE
jgi:phage terminase large subunit-like protein